MKRYYKILNNLLWFCIWWTLIWIVYIIFPSQQPHKINCDNQSHQQIIDKLDNISITEYKCFVYVDWDNVWYINLPCPDVLPTNKDK